MKYARIANGAVAEFPYSASKLRIDNPGTSFPDIIPDERLADYGVLPVQPTAPPAVPLEKNLVESVPTYAGGVCTQQWTLVDASAEEIARRTEIAAQAGELGEAKLDAWVTQFLGMTPQGAMDYVNTNGTTVATLRPLVARLAYVVRVLVRREFNR